MKICIIVEGFPRLSETFVLDQALGLAARGHDVEILCRKRTPGSESVGDAARLRTRQWWGGLAFLDDITGRLSPRLQHKLRGWLDMLQVAHLRRFDVLLAHFGYQGARVAGVIERAGAMPPLVTIFHGHDVGTVLHDGATHLYQQLFRHGALQLTVNDVFRRTLVEAGAPAARTRVHHMGISAGAIPFAPRSSGKGPLTILSVSRLTEKKGIAYALRALARVKELRPDLRWRYRIIGDGELREELQRLAAKLSIEDQVAFLGARPHVEVRQNLAECDVFLLPSVTAANGDAEGIPVSLMEAMASGALVVSTLHSGIPELVEDGVGGLLAPERDAAALADKLLAVAEDPSVRNAMARAARCRVEADFNMDVQLDRLEEELTSVVCARGGGVEDGTLATVVDAR